ncbi:MAG TPA: hypothetical protein VM529_20845 [Gemmata sp.]|nr:hypothetical protein [Gemmata sp.]
MLTTIRIAAAAWLPLLALGGSTPADDKKEPGEPYIEIDFTPMPEQVRWRFTITIETTDKDLKFAHDFNLKSKRFDLCEIVANYLNDGRFRAEVVDKSKVRVYGRTFNEKFFPVTKGSVTSPDLDKEQLPTVRYVGRKL